MHVFHEITPEELALNPYRAIGKDWMLVTVANGEKTNLMTASWGGFGILWEKPVVFICIRPCRHTLELLDRKATFSLAFFDERYRAQLKLCGSKSGRDTDKTAACGFDIARTGETPYVQQAHTVLVCRKLYRQAIESNLFLHERDRSKQTFHDVTFIAELEQVLVAASS